MVETHRDCLDVSILENIIKDVKTSDIFNEIEQLINEMIEIIGKIKQNRETNSSAVTEQKIVVGNEIRELRTRINNHLDKLQEDLMKELTETENQITDETRDLMVSLDEKQKELTEYQTNVVNIRKYESDLHKYLAVKQIEKEVETHETCIQALVNSDSLNKAKLSYWLDAGLKTITTSIQKFGEVIVESKPCELTFARKKDKQAQMMVADLSPPISVDNIQLNLKQKINIKGRNIRGCSFLPDSRIVLSCWGSGTISFINKEGVESFQIAKRKRGSDTYDSVYIKDSNSVAVSSGFGGNRCITIIDIVSSEVLTTISMDANIVGMAIRGGTIYYCAWEKGLKKRSLGDNSVSDIINRDMTAVYYVAASEDKLYYANYEKHTVTCCDLHGTTQWEFNSERVLQVPRGISVDNDGNVYVVGYESNNVVVISSDGQRHIQLSSSKDGLVNPCVLEYDKSTNRLLVVNEEHTAFLFDVTRRE
jgi:WD40 repeat protein